MSISEEGPNVVEKFKAFRAKLDNLESKELYSLMSIVRGPDFNWPEGNNYDIVHEMDRLKTHTSARVRTILGWSDDERNCGGFTSGEPVNMDVVREHVKPEDQYSIEKGKHFEGHVRTAFKILVRLGYKEFKL